MISSTSAKPVSRQTAIDAKQNAVNQVTAYFNGTQKKANAIAAVDQAKTTIAAYFAYQPAGAPKSGLSKDDLGFVNAMVTKVGIAGYNASEPNPKLHVKTGLSIVDAMKVVQLARKVAKLTVAGSGSPLTDVDAMRLQKLAFAIAKDSVGLKVTQEEVAEFNALAKRLNSFPS